MYAGSNGVIKDGGKTPDSTRVARAHARRLLYTAVAHYVGGFLLLWLPVEVGWKSYVGNSQKNLARVLDAGDSHEDVSLAYTCLHRWTQISHTIFHLTSSKRKALRISIVIYWPQDHDLYLAFVDSQGLIAAMQYAVLQNFLRRRREGQENIVVSIDYEGGWTCLGMPMVDVEEKSGDKKKTQ